MDIKYLFSLSYWSSLICTIECALVHLECMFWSLGIGTWTMELPLDYVADKLMEKSPVPPLLPQTVDKKMIHNHFLENVDQKHRNIDLNQQLVCLIYAEWCV